MSLLPVLVPVLGKWLRLMCRLTIVARLASVEQHRQRREDRVGHENYGLLDRKPAHVAERHLGAVLDEPPSFIVEMTPQQRSAPEFVGSALEALLLLPR